MRPSLIVVALGLLAGIACAKKSDAEKSAAPTCATCVTADQHGYTPSALTLPKGGPGSKATVTFTRTSDDTCAREVVVPDLKINTPLPLNKPVAIEFPTDTARELTFQCGMAMYKGKLVVN
jgi:plastocyanin domain-containing protein